MVRDGFNFNRSFYDSIKFLPKKEMIESVLSICEYALNSEFNDNDVLSKHKNEIDLQGDRFNQLKTFHWNYKGGISNENNIVRASSEMKQWRISVFKRDNYTCNHCFVYGGKLNAHHIKSFKDYHELRLNINNGITLCFECHKKEHKRLRNEQ